MNMWSWTSPHVTGLPYLRFPNIHEKCLEFGIDITGIRIRCPGGALPLRRRGGQRTWRNENRESCSPARCLLYRATRANRLASNSLLEAALFATVYQRCPPHGRLAGDPLPIPPWDPRGATESTSRSWFPKNWTRSAAACGSMWGSSVRTSPRAGPAPDRSDQPGDRRVLTTTSSSTGFAGTAKHRRGRPTDRGLRADAQGKPRPPLQSGLSGEGRPVLAQGHRGFPGGTLGKDLKGRCGGAIRGWRSPVPPSPPRR